MLGEEAHIVSPKPGGPRFRPLATDQVDKYDNLVLLCPEDHTLVDKRPKVYTEDDVLGLKLAHEGWVRQRGKASPELRIRDLHVGEPLVLRRIDRGDELMSSLSQGLSYSIRHPDLTTREDMDIVADFLAILHDWAEIWSEIGPGEQLKAEFEIGERVDELREAGFVVYGGLREKVLEGGIAGPVPWNEFVISIHRSDDPLIRTDPSPREVASERRSPATGTS